MSGDTRPFPFGVFVPPVSTHNALVRFRGITGNIIQGSQIIIDDDDNITMPGGSKINGRSVFADGVKLDGIELKATRDQTGAEIVALLEALAAGARLSHNYLDDVGADDHHDEAHTHYYLTASDGTPILALRVNATGGVGIGIDAAAWLHLPAGIASAGGAPLKLVDGTLLTTEEKGALEYSENKLYFTSHDHRRVLDRTSDVIIATTTISNSANEETIYTADLHAGDSFVGNVMKLDTSGLISNVTASDDITINFYIGATLIATLNPAMGNVSGAHWMINGDYTFRTVGGSASVACHTHIMLDDHEVMAISIETVNTTIAHDFTVKVQWDNAKGGNTINILQGFMEIKN